MAGEESKQGGARQPGRWPCLFIAAILAGTVFGLAVEGRRWWCACGGGRLWIQDVWTEHCSQHLADPYSITHVSHGVIFGIALAALLRRTEVRWRLAIALAVAGAWEVVENSAWVIERYRQETMSLNYLGDSIANALGDVLSCWLGFLGVQRFGWKAAVIFFVASELVLVWMIRDNLTLNVIMLAWPIDAIKDWQSIGHTP